MPHKQNLCKIANLKHSRNTQFPKSQSLSVAINSIVILILNSGGTGAQAREFKQIEDSLQTTVG